MKIDIKEAVKNVFNYLEEMKSYFYQDIKEIRLEEVDLSEDEKFWLITLGFKILDEDPPSFVEKALNPNIADKRYIREYKIFEVDAEKGTVKSMKIREV